MCYMTRFPSYIPDLTAYRSRDFTMKHPKTHDYAWTIGDMTLTEIMDYGSVFKYVIALTKHVISLSNKTGSPDKNLYKYWRSGISEFVAIKDYIDARIDDSGLLKTPKTPKFPTRFGCDEFFILRDFSMCEGLGHVKPEDHLWFGWVIKDITPDDVLSCGSVENYVSALAKHVISILNRSAYTNEEVYLYWRKNTPEFKFLVSYLKRGLPGSKPYDNPIARMLNTHLIIVNLD